MMEEQLVELEVRSREALLKLLDVHNEALDAVKLIIWVCGDNIVTHGLL